MYVQLASILCLFFTTTLACVLVSNSSLLCNFPPIPAAVVSSNPPLPHRAILSRKTCFMARLRASAGRPVRHPSFPFFIPLNRGRNHTTPFAGFVCWFGGGTQASHIAKFSDFPAAMLCYLKFISAVGALDCMSCNVFSSIRCGTYTAACDSIGVSCSERLATNYAGFVDNSVWQVTPPLGVPYGKLQQGVGFPFSPGRASCNIKIISYCYSKSTAKCLFKGFCVFSF